MLLSSPTFRLHHCQLYTNLSPHIPISGVLLLRVLYLRILGQIGECHHVGEMGSDRLLDCALCLKILAKLLGGSTFKVNFVIRVLVVGAFFQTYSRAQHSPVSKVSSLHPGMEYITSRNYHPMTNLHRISEHTYMHFFHAQSGREPLEDPWTVITCTSSLDIPSLLCVPLTSHNNVSQVTTSHSFPIIFNQFSEARLNKTWAEECRCWQTA